MTEAIGKRDASTRSHGRRLMGEAQEASHWPVEGGTHRGVLRLDREEALGYLGYSGQRVDPDLLSRFGRIVDGCERDLRPSWVYDVFDVDGERTRPRDGRPESGEGSDAESHASGMQEPGVGLFGTSLVLPGRDIADHVRGARKVALMACTLGVASERALRAYAAVSPTDALLYDAAASALVEAAANEAEAAIAAWADERGLYAGPRFSPGYGDFPLSVQPAFLAAIDATRRIGLTTIESFMLVPSKSVTAVVGLFDHRQPGRDTRTECGPCRLRDCCHLAERGGSCHG